METIIQKTQAGALTSKLQQGWWGPITGVVEQWEPMFPYPGPWHQLAPRVWAMPGLDVAASSPNHWARRGGAMAKSPSRHPICCTWTVDSRLWGLAGIQLPHLQKGKDIFGIMGEHTSSTSFLEHTGHFINCARDDGVAKPLRKCSLDLLYFICNWSSPTTHSSSSIHILSAHWTWELQEGNAEIVVTIIT
jgi:hypothetical protein